MGIDARTSLNDSHVLVECNGAFSVEGLLGVLDGALDAAAEAGLLAALVDIRSLSGNPPNSIERHEIGAHVAARQRNMRYEVALVVVGSEPIVDPERFAEVVARNRGAHARVFTDFDEAMQWIVQEAAQGG